VDGDRREVFLSPACDLAQSGSGAMMCCGDAQASGGSLWRVGVFNA
jgi:hypothetical protein